ncbi:glycoside hydrolase family 32 protein [Alkalibacterium sp. s-m-22]|jgi:beta-fructofuranosidase|uniref:beta-fructofuranosidase n=1 Tax=Alkalibacterium indicireducens TaxID=398758 RepID=A0ABN1B6Y9_9LACT
MNYSLNNANQIVKEKKNEVNKQYYPTFHFAPTVGWMNDPNGVSFYQEYYHLFYQYYPYDSQWGPMHWGHAKSKDGLKWEHLPVALAPDENYDKGGCFSGSAIEKDGILYLMYTGHLPNEEDETLTRQNQNIAFSEDGVNFVKYENNPVLSEEDVPSGSSVVDFRDPKIVEKNGTYYCVIGSKTVNNEGQVLLYKSNDLFNWEFVSVVLEHNKYLGSMVECPDLLLFEKKQVFMLSAMDYTDEVTKVFYPHITWIIEGEMDWNKYKFEVSKVYEMDKGLDFYAPQSVRIGEQYVAFAWMQGWNRTLPTHDNKHLWAGQMSLPRTIAEEGLSLKFNYLENIKDQIKEDLVISNFDFEEELIIGNPVEYLKVKISNQVINNFEITFSNELNEQLKSIIENNTVVFSRESLNVEIRDYKQDKLSETKRTNYKGDFVDIEFFVDKSSIEIFINGESSITSTYYMDSPITNVLLSSTDTLKIDTIVTGDISK